MGSSGGPTAAVQERGGGLHPRHCHGDGVVGGTVSGACVCMRTCVCVCVCVCVYVYEGAGRMLSEVTCQRLLLALRF